MFCSNCGTKIPNESRFCTNCGATIEEEERNYKSTNINVDLKGASNFAVTAIKSPMSASTELLNSFSDKMIFFYFEIMTIITAFVGTITVNSFIDGFTKKMMRLSGISDELGMFDGSALASIKMIQKTILPFKDIFIWFFVAITIFYLLTILAVLLTNKLINNNDIEISKYFVIASVALTVQVAFSVAIYLVSYISILLAALLMLIQAITILLVLYRGFAELITENIYFVYIFAVIVTIAYLITIYVVAKMVGSHILSLINNPMLRDMLPIDDLYDLFNMVNYF